MADTNSNPVEGQTGQQHINSNGVLFPQPGMPPQLNIPQSIVPAPAALAPGQISQDSASAQEPNKRALYVGGLDPRITEDVLRQVFETTGRVSSAKVVPEKSFQSKGFNYGFVEYDDPAAAERAMQTLNGRRIHQSEIRVNWAYQSTNVPKEDTTGHHHIFVGDLSNEVNDEVLLQAFSTFGTVSEARVMWDMKTHRSRGYGFVAFKDRPEAEKALAAMDGEWLGSRAIRCNWANQKGQPTMLGQQQPAHMPLPMNPGSAVAMTPGTPFGGQQQQQQPPPQHGFPTQGINSYDMIVQQTPQWQTTVYVGNLTPYTTQADLVPLFLNFGYIAETRFQSDRGFAFVKMATHENAATAICQLNGYPVNGRPLKCSWGKDRPPAGAQHDGISPAVGGPHSAFPQTPQGYGGFPQYGAPPAMSPQVYGTPYGAGPGMGQYGQMPQSAGGFGRGGPGGYMGQPQTAPYGGYQGY